MEIKYTWVKCFTGQTTQYLMYHEELTKDTCAFPCKEGHPKGEYFSGYSFIIPGGVNHDLILNRLINLILNENKENPKKHNVELITTFIKTVTI